MEVDRTKGFGFVGNRGSVLGVGGCSVAGETGVVTTVDSRGDVVGEMEVRCDA